MFRIHQEGIGRAAGTVERYRYTFPLFARFLESEGLDATRDCLTSETITRFASWMRAAPTTSLEQAVSLWIDPWGYPQPGVGGLHARHGTQA